MQRQLVSVGLAVLLALGTLSVVTAAPLAFDPTHCATVSVEATASGYNVVATGWGRYARIRDLTAAQTAVTTDFGYGATVFTWDVSLDVGHQYQVQVSSTGLTYTSANCLFTPPEPQSVIIDRFEWVNGAFEWSATEDGLGYWIVGPRFSSGFVPAQSPGNFGYFSYRLAPWQRMRDGVYDLWAQDVTGRSGVVATLVKGGGK